MAGNKNIKNDASVEDFLNSIEKGTKRDDSFKILEIMKDITKLTPKMWGDSMVGFGSYHYKYKSGHEGDYFLTGFSPRKKNISIYIIPGFKIFKNIMAKIGKHKTSVSCLYINKLSDIDEILLRKLIGKSVDEVNRVYNSEAT
jgi:hypothetical protein